jgi:hypothetical protein
MKLSTSSARTWLGKALRSLGKGATGAALLAGSAALTAGCLDRPVTPATPTTNNVFIGQIRQTGVDKIDLLFMIDNSISMADKQRILAEAVPVLVNRLITPVCVDDEGNTVGPQPCQGGSAPEFKAVQDIHIGIVTSSIGDHGSNDVCSAGSATAENTYNDLAQLVPTVRPNANPPLTSWNNQGFLVWDPRDADPGITPHMPPGYGSPLGGSPGNAQAMIDAFTTHLQSTGEHGCGYEAQLESWYRFLIDPEPVSGMMNDGAQFSVRGAVNQAVLTQRAAFLRTDSLLAIIMLTDENDCSILDEDQTQGWLVPFKGGVMANSWRMPRAHQICATSPNDRACAPCSVGDPDPACAMGVSLSIAEDAPNVRCFKQKQRFGVDLLYPIGRYVQGLTSPIIDPRLRGEQKPNPIFASAAGEPPRDPGLVFLAGIIGVPWQDIATDGSVMGQPNSLAPGRDIQYMTANEILQAGRWDVILGDPDNARNPTDPFMIESVDARPVTDHPFLNGVRTTANGGQPNPVNGFEQNVIASERADLQFACIFDLVPDVDCTMANEGGCDCNADEFAKNSPLCNYPTPMMDGQQRMAKAYPGLRELQVLKGIGSNAIVASICPKNVAAQGGPLTDPFYGYNPAVSAIVSRLKEALTAKCLPRALLPEDNPMSPDVGKVPCAVVEVRPKVNGACEMCDPRIGRTQLVGDEAKIIPSVMENMESLRQCGGGALTPCSEFCMCKLQQFTIDTDTNGQGTPDLMECVNAGTDPGNLYGYCYVDPTVDVNGDGTPDANPVLLDSCDPTQKRILRFLGNNVPSKDGLAFIACIGEAASKAQ